MNKEILEIILKANINYLCELYQYANQNYFISYIDDDKVEIKLNPTPYFALILSL